MLSPVDNKTKTKYLFNKMENQLRHIRTPKRTTISLEADFWQQIEVLAKQRGLSWRQWSENTLNAKPIGTNSASWLRVNCLLSTKESYGKETTR
jgi:predicted DNA-binding ribbon-helix-helix protein